MPGPGLILVSFYKFAELFGWREEEKGGFLSEYGANVGAVQQKDAEVSGGGFPGWMQRLKGRLRTMDEDYLAATDK